MRALREGGRVQRMHAMDHHGTYSVGQHCYDAVNLVLCLHPDPSPNLIKAVLWHDSAERWTGDVPGPAKRAASKLEAELDELEDQILDSMGCQLTLTNWDRVWLEAVDKIELWLWVHEQMRLGNTTVHAVLDNVLAYFETLRSLDRFPPECDAFMRHYIHERGSDALPI